VSLLLAIDTSTRWASVALAEEGAVRSQRVWESNRNHGAELMPAILELLQAAGRRVHDLSGIAVAIGPGGFSALRVGVAAAKGLALPLGLPVAGVSTYDVEVFRIRGEAETVFAVVNAGSSGVAWARYDRSAGEGRTASGVESPESLIARAPAGAIFCGEGGSRLEGLAQAGSIRNATPPTRDPAALVTLACMQFERGAPDDPAALAPEYARPPSITRPKS